MLSTAVANSTSTVVFPIRHKLAGTNPADTGLPRMGGSCAHILVTGLDERQFSGHNEEYNYNQLVGQIMPVRPSRPSSEQWYLSEDDHEPGGAYLTGALVNPTPVNGRVYQELLPYERVNKSPFYLRYNDDAHAEDRAQRTNPWTIVWAQEELNHEVGHARVVQPGIYVEVQWPLVDFGSPVTTGLASDEDIELILSEVDDAASAVAAHVESQTIDNSVVGHTIGKAHVEEDGRVLLDPPLVPGDMYLTWYNGTTWYEDHVMVQIATSDERFTSVGYFHRGSDGVVYFHDDIYADVRGPEWGAADTTQHWAKLGLTEPEVNTEASTLRAAALVEEAEQSHNAFEDLNDALNRLANQQSWCGEYERTMEMIGMRHRRSSGRVPYDPDNLLDGPVQRHAYDIQYDVEATISDDSPNYRVINALESDYSVSSVSELRFDASLTVTIYGVVADNEEDAENSITQSMIEAEVENMVDGSVEINDYSHSDTTEDDDFDWDEYDG